MDIDLSSEIEGIPLRKIRDLFKRVDRRFAHPFVAKQLGISESHAHRVVAALCRDNLVEREPDDWFILTVRGNALAMVKIRRPITRAEAENIVEQLLSRISTINQDPYFLYVIAEASVFGSYVGDAPCLRDVDVVLKLEFRPSRTPEQAVRESERRAAASSKRLDIVSRYYYGQIEVIEELKTISRYLSLHDESEVSRMGVEPVPLYVRGR